MKYLTSSVLIAAALAARAQHLELKPGDHISIIGNTLADRMQLDGTLEAMIQQTFPQLDLSVRNLGFSGDELTERYR